MKFFFSRINRISPDQFWRFVEAVNEVCGTDYEVYKTISGNVESAKDIISRKRKYSLFDENDADKISEIIDDESILVRVLIIDVFNNADRKKDTSEQLCKGIKIVLGPNSWCDISYEVVNPGRSEIEKYHRLITLFEILGWQIANSLACFYKKADFVWALQGVEYGLVGPKTKIAVMHAVKHYASTPISRIQDVYQANAVAVSHVKDNELKELEDICDHVGLLHKGGILLSKDL